MAKKSKQKEKPTKLEVATAIATIASQATIAIAALIEALKR